MKRYELKIYSQANLNVPKKTLTFISWNKEAIKLKNDFRFDWNANNWQWALRITLNEKFNYWDADLGDIVRIRWYDDNNKQWRGIYAWYIEQLKRRIDTDWESIELSLFGLATLMTTIIAGGGIFNYVNTDPAVMMTDLLNQFNSNFSSPLITFPPIPLTWTLVDFRVDDTPILEALKQVNEIVWYIFYIDGDGVFTTQPKWTIPDHKFTVKYDINVIESNIDRSDIVTRLYLSVLNFSVPFPNQRITFIYDNLPAQAQYWIIEEFVTNVSLATYTGLQTPWIDAFANTYLQERSQPKNFIRLELNDKADFLTIKPWDLIRIQNLDFTLQDAIINRINYSSTAMQVDCEKTLDFGQEVVNST